MSEFVISRVFEAPRDLVFRVWTEFRHLEHWWGPKGFTVVAGSIDLRPGGEFHYGIRSPDGKLLWGKWVFREVTAPYRLEFLASFSDENGGITRHPFSENWPLRMLSVVTFDEMDGRTKVTLRADAFESTDTERDAFDSARPSMTAGWTGTLDQMDDYLSQVNTAAV